MAETVKSLRVRVIIDSVVTGDDGTELRISETYDKTFTNGTSENQVGYVWNDQNRPLNTTSETLDLDGLSDFQGQVMSNNNNVKLMYFRNLDLNTGDDFKLGGGDFSTPWNDATDKSIIGPDGLLLMINPVDGFTITASSGDGLLVEAVDNSSYRLIFAGDNA